jgi:hypothetical protein
MQQNAGLFSQHVSNIINVLLKMGIIMLETFWENKPAFCCIYEYEWEPSLHFPIPPQAFITPSTQFYTNAALVFGEGLTYLL